MSSAPACKICGSATSLAFALPASKMTGHPIPDLPDDCPYYECTECHFCFTDYLDDGKHDEIYDDEYWTRQDPDWYGRVGETLRLILLANTLVKREPYKIDILDFGCGVGGSVERFRQMQMNAWGTDIIPPRVGQDFFLKEIGSNKFDIIVSCEVLEHIPNPRETFHRLKSWLKPGGAFAFQTAEYNPRVENREWWYVGPGNGHISFYSRQAFDHLYAELGGTERLMWNKYPGVQAWKFD